MPRCYTEEQEEEALFNNACLSVLLVVEFEVRGVV